MVTARQFVRLNPDPNEFPGYTIARGDTAHADYRIIFVAPVLPHAVSCAPHTRLFIGVAGMGHLVNKRTNRLTSSPHWLN